LQARKAFSIFHSAHYRFDAFRDDLDAELLCNPDETAARVADALILRPELVS
jgi:hypothetical protein